MIERRADLNHIRGQVYVAEAIALRRERECVLLLAGRVGVLPLAGVGRIGGTSGDGADWNALSVREEVEKAVLGYIHRLAGSCSRADVDSRRAARAVLHWDVEACQPVSFEGPIAATTGRCMRVRMCARARVWAIAPCDVPLWQRKCSAYRDARLGFAQNAAGTAPVRALFLRSILVTARSKAIESGMVPTKRFCWKRLHRIILGRHYVNPMRCDSD